MAEGASPLDQALDGFLTHARVEQGLAPRTVEAYGRDLSRFVAFLLRRGASKPEEIVRAQVSGFLESLAREGLSARSRARALVAVRRLVRHLQATGRMTDDPLEGLGAPRLTQRLPRTLDSAEVERLLGAVPGEEP
ncbi:MAG: site-specific integrase, partial [Myxococcota bacterium]